MQYVITTTQDSSRQEPGEDQHQWFAEAFREGADEDSAPAFTSGFHATAEAAEAALQQEVRAADASAQFVDEAQCASQRPKL